jgi:hypothetical protein
MPLFLFIFIFLFLFFETSYSISKTIEYNINHNNNHFSLGKIGLDNNLASDVLPAKIQMVYDNKTYEGKPIFYIYRGDSSFSDFQKPYFNISNINTEVITLENGSEVDFKIIDYPQVITPSYLGITAYKDSGETVQIIENEEYNKTKTNDTNKTIDMEEGYYTLIATATWDGESDDVEGYQLNAFKINLINSENKK